jgi:hypothetical protein
MRETDRIPDGLPDGPLALERKDVGRPGTAGLGRVKMVVPVRKTFFLTQAPPGRRSHISQRNTSEFQEQITGQAGRKLSIRVKPIK